MNAKFPAMKISFFFIKKRLVELIQERMADKIDWNLMFFIKIFFKTLGTKNPPPHQNKNAAPALAS